MRLLYRYVTVGVGSLGLIALLLYHFHSKEKKVIHMRDWGPDAIFFDPFGTHLKGGKFPESRIKFSDGDEANAFQKNEAQWMMDLRKHHHINVFMSDFLPLNRPIPDSRPRGCSTLKYSSSLPSLSVVIAYHNEWPSVLLRTVFSIVNRTPKHILKEIILVDDNSQSEDYKTAIYKYIRQSFQENLVLMISLPTRSGLVRARLAGLKHVTAQTVAFFDSHMEANVGWAEPLLQEIITNNRTVAMAQLDYIGKNSLKYVFTEGYRTRYGFDWRLHFFETEFRKDQLAGKKDTDVLPGVVTAGAAFVVDTQYFRQIGSYDEGMKIWGGENLELSWRVWLCGGRLVHVPCSRVGHIARDQPYNFLEERNKVELHNYHRAVGVWLGTYIQYVNDARPEIKNTHAGDVSDRVRLKNRLQCRNFDWFLHNVWPELFVYKTNVTVSGGAVLNELKPPSCLDNNMYLFSSPSSLRVDFCTFNVMKQNFALTLTHQLRTILQCVTVVREDLEYVPKLANCLEVTDQWYHTKDGLLQQSSTGLCLGLLRHSLVMTECTPGSSTQTWTFANQMGNNERSDNAKLS